MANRDRFGRLILAGDAVIVDGVDIGIVEESTRTALRLDGRWFHVRPELARVVELEASNPLFAFQQAQREALYG